MSPRDRRVRRDTEAWVFAIGKSYGYDSSSGARRVGASRSNAGVLRPHACRAAAARSCLARDRDPATARGPLLSTGQSRRAAHGRPSLEFDAHLKTRHSLCWAARRDRGGHRRYTATRFAKFSLSLASSSTTKRNGSVGGCSLSATTRTTSVQPPGFHWRSSCSGGASFRPSE